MLWANPRLSCALLLAGAWRAVGQNVVRIDDSFAYDPTSNLGGIQYTRRSNPYEWNTVTTGDPSQRYQNTYTQTQTSGSQLYFAFRGSSIAYFADKPPGNGTFAVSLDGNTRVNVNWTNAGATTQYQQLLWSTSGLDSRDHSLVISNALPNNMSLGLDYLAVTPWNGTDITPRRTGPGASSISPKAVVVDNEDPTIRYTGAWRRWITSGGGSNLNMYFNSTEHCTTTPGDSVSFQFNGTAFWYLAEDYPTGCKLAFTIDGQLGQVASSAGYSSVWSTQKLVWGTTGLTPEPHNITVTHAGGGTWACLDFLMYVPSSASSATSTPTSTPLPSSSGSSSTPVGAIAGGVVGGVVLIAVLVMFILAYRKCQSRRERYSPDQGMHTGDIAYQTKLVDPPYMANNLVSVPMPSQQPYAPYGHMNGAHSVPATTWSSPTYTGHPEPH